MTHRTIGASVGLVCKDPAGCVMRYGAVVRRRDRPTERGVVNYAHGAGDKSSNWGPMYRNDAVIKLQPGHAVVTNLHYQWELVPVDEQTSVERVKHAWMTFDQWSDEPRETDSIEFAVLRALLTPAETDRVFEFDWPTGLWELSLVVAACIDDRVAGARTLGSALARL